MIKTKNDNARIDFIDTYLDFNNWLMSIGFRSGNYKESTTPMDYNYSIYNTDIKSLSGVELYIHDILEFSIRFLRDSHVHKIKFIQPSDIFDRVLTLEEAKKYIFELTKSTKEEKMRLLNSLTINQ